jgi:putative MFS transporter
MASALGAATGALAYGAWLVPYGMSWRWLYLIALPPLALTIAAKRVLPESRRYDEARSHGALNTRWHDILRKPHRRWMVLVGGTDLLFALATIAEVFAIDFMQTDRGLSTTHSNLVLVAAGLLAIPVLVFAGSLSDNHGRKRVGCMFGILSVVGLLGFFFLARHPLELFGFMALTLIGQFGAWPTLDAYTAELFPTGLRAFASSFTSLWRVLGESGSLILGGALMAFSGSLGATVGLLAAGPLIAVIIIWRKFPETNGVELEDITDAPIDVVDLAPRKHAPAGAHARVG